MIFFTDHARDKLQKEMKKLGITEKTVKQVVSKPEEMLYDALTGRFVAVGLNHRLAVVHEVVNHDFFVVTVIYSTQLKDVVKNRRRAGRWI